MDDDQQHQRQAPPLVQEQAGQVDRHERQERDGQNQVDDQARLVAPDAAGRVGAAEWAREGGHPVSPFEVAPWWVRFRGADAARTSVADRAILALLSAVSKNVSKICVKE